MKLDASKLVLLFDSTLYENERVQFNMWDNHIFGNLDMQDKVQDPQDDSWKVK